MREKEWYGFELVRAMASIDGMVTGEGTVYPLLARLRLAGPGGDQLAGVSDRAAPPVLPARPARAGGSRRFRRLLAAVARQRR